ncbi:OmpA family protein [Flagellimonas flava]|uniref:Outer membrane protein OmpA n=1 Tax=Flagellimonas flava TaxID=570519 RepID=A0A1M5MBU5_9FLAO|nr:OmpA family protein [Allomuricauda flava]SHG74748.1 Outer membrane protein OmpA [Allomuricauda flava]
MKIKIALLFSCAFFLGFGTSNAQFLKKLGKRAERAAENTVLRKTDQKVSKETEKAMDTILNGNKKTKRKKQNKTKEPREDQESLPNNTSESETQKKPGPSVWSAYNFVPGDEVIFFDDLRDEENGEFPSRWDILKGNAENASFEGENVIAMKHESIIMPLMDTHNYLPEVFTLEFDIYFDVKKYSYRSNYYLRLGPEIGSHYFGEGNKNWITAITIKKNGIKFSTDVNGVRKNFQDAKNELEELGQGAWRHIAIAFNKRSFKIFINEHRVVNIPNLGFKPEMFSIGYSNNYASDDEVIVVKNIRLAKGGKKLYDRVIQEGKFVTRGILFTVNSATIKPESGGVLKEVAAMMQDHADLNFKIEGHTDSDGDEEYNLSLSKQRAEAVKQALIDLGIADGRLTTEGRGESVPVANNTSPEGKANNRRVEFIKI